MKIKSTENSIASVVIINLPERVAGEVSDQLKNFIKDIIERNKYKLVMNLDKTKFMDSAGLGALVSKISVARANQGDVRLAAPHEYIKNLLEITHLDQIIKIYVSVKEAVLSFKEQA